MGKLSRVADAPSSIGDFDPQLQSNHLKYLKAVQGLDGSSAKDLERAAQACEKQCTWVRKLTRDKSVSPPLESSTPMLVIPYNVWLTLKRIPKNVKAWRNTALSKGWLVMYESSMIVVFISHTWWDREFTDETNDPTNQYDKGSPDFQTGLNKDLKYRSICRGLEDLIAECDFDPSRVHVLIDWACIYQDDMEMKMEGVRSLLGWIGKSSALYVPLQECGAAFRFYEQLPGVGWRGWCLMDPFVYTQFSKLNGDDTRIFYGTERETRLLPPVRYMGGPAQDLPSQGLLANPNDRALLVDLEDQIIEVTVASQLQRSFARTWLPRLDLSSMLLSDSVLLPCIIADLRKFTNLKAIDVESNRLGDASLEVIATASPPNLEALSLGFNKFADAGFAALATSIGSGKFSRLRVLSAHNNGIGNEGVAAFAGVCERLPALQELGLQHNKVGDEGLAKLCAVWGPSSAFKPSRVFLSKNQLTARSLECLGSLGPTSWERLKVLKVAGNDFSEASLRQFGGMIKQHVLNKSCFLDLDAVGQLGIQFPPWPAKKMVSGEPTIHLLSVDALLGCNALLTVNSDDVVRLHWKGKGHLRDLFPESAFKTCSLAELRDGVHYSALTYMWKTPWAAILAELQKSVASQWIWIDAFCLNQTDGDQIAKTLNYLDQIYVTASEYHVIALESVSRGWCLREMSVNPPQRKMQVHSSAFGVKGSDMVWLQANEEISLSFAACAMSDEQDRAIVEKGIIGKFATIAAFDEYVNAVVIPQLPEDAQKLLFAKRKGR